MQHREMSPLVWTRAVVVIACLVACLPLFAASPPSHVGNTKTVTQPQQLAPEQKLAEWQARYYRLQTEELESTRGFWGKVKANPVAVAAVLGAFATILVGLLNYRQTLGNQRDTQFYEALKRLGDDSPAVRCSAAGLLALMGQEHESYHRTALDELISALTLERNLAVYDSTITAIQSVMRLDPPLSIARLYRANILLQRQMKYGLARLFGFMGVEGPDQITDDQWDMASRICQYQSDVLKALVTRPLWQERFASNLSSSYESWKRGEQEAARGEQDKAQEQLGLVASKLRDNVALIAENLHDRVLPGLNLSDVFLAEGNLDDALLQGANLRGAQMQCSHLTSAQLQTADLTESLLQGVTAMSAQMQGAILYRADIRSSTLAGASFEGADLRAANLHGACLTNADLHGARLFGVISNTGAFAQADWWQADFTSDNPMYKDTNLLRDLCRKFRSSIPDDLDHVHPSARDYIRSVIPSDQNDQSPPEADIPPDDSEDG